MVVTSSGSQRPSSWRKPGSILKYEGSKWIPDRARFGRVRNDGAFWSARAALELLERVRLQRRHALDRARVEDDFADIHVAAFVDPDAVRCDEIAGEDRVLTAHQGGDLAVGVHYRNPRDRRVAARRVYHRLVVRRERAFGALHHVVVKAALRDVQHVLVVDEDVVRAVEQRPACAAPFAYV